jgi:hypothetical protein
MRLPFTARSSANVTDARDLRKAGRQSRSTRRRADIAEVARQAGHSVEECARTYVHVFEEFAGKRINAEETIRAARDHLG